MEFVLLINLKLLSAANSFLLNIAEHENSSANKYENPTNVDIFFYSYFLVEKMWCSYELSMNNLGAWSNAAECRVWK